MMRLVLALGACLWMVGAAWAEGFNPHEMMQPDGSADMSKCSLCHDESFALARSKAETCTLCHAETMHSGSLEHLRAGPAAVARLLPATDGKVAWPLTDDGNIYCGTCHLFHDPGLKLGKEQALEATWVRSSSGVANAIRIARTTRADALAAEVEGAEKWGGFSAKGTRMLRLPAGDGSLCRHCHADYAVGE